MLVPAEEPSQACLACLVCQTSLACQTGLACYASLGSLASQSCLAYEACLASLASLSLVNSCWYLQVKFPSFHLTYWRREDNLKILKIEYLSNHW